jgi:hypothetical protein
MIRFVRDKTLPVKSDCICVFVLKTAQPPYSSRRAGGLFLVDQLLLVFVQAASRACNMVQLKYGRIPRTERQNSGFTYHTTRICLSFLPSALCALDFRLYSGVVQCEIRKIEGL